MFGDKLKSFTSFLPKIFNNKKTVVIITVAGFVGILLIGLSEWFKGENHSVSEIKTEEISVGKYIDILEDKTEKMLLSIDGAGKCKVMITAQSSAAQQYVFDEDITDEIQADGDDKKEKTNKQTEIVIVEGDSGEKKALVSCVVEPEIRGVLVLCEGANNPETKEKITEAVKTILGIYSNKICVLKLK